MSSLLNYSYPFVFIVYTPKFLKLFNLLSFLLFIISMSRVPNVFVPPTFESMLYLSLLNVPRLAP